MAANGGYECDWVLIESNSLMFTGGFVCTIFLSIFQPCLVLLPDVCHSARKVCFIIPLIPSSLQDLLDSRLGLSTSSTRSAPDKTPRLEKYPFAQPISGHPSDSRKEEVNFGIIHDVLRKTSAAVQDLDRFLTVNGETKPVRNWCGDAIGSLHILFRNYQLYP